MLSWILKQLRIRRVVRISVFVRIVSSAADYLMRSQ